MEGSVQGVEISGIVSAVPSRVVDNMDYAKDGMERQIKKQIRLTGIRKRHVAEKGQTATDLASVAGDELIKKLGWDKNDIRAVVYVTQSEDLQRPASAFLIQKRLGIGQNCIVFDINQGCAGYVIGLSVISGLLSQSKGKGILFVGESHAVADENGNHNILLDGDAASATALAYTGAEKKMCFAHFGDGARANYIYCRHGENGHMDGNAVLMFALSDVADMVKQAFGSGKVKKEEIDFYVFHQAQKMLVDGIVQEAKIPEDKVLMSCEEYGNTSSASIPLSICVNKDSLMGSEKIKLFMCGYGIGLTWGYVVAEIDLKAISSVIETDYVYADREEFE